MDIKINKNLSKEIKAAAKLLDTNSEEFICVAVRTYLKILRLPAKEAILIYTIIERYKNGDHDGED